MINACSLGYVSAYSWLRMGRLAEQTVPCWRRRGGLELALPSSHSGTLVSSPSPTLLVGVRRSCHHSR